jgi:hypothetical protein
MNHLFAPQLRLARPVPVAGFIDKLAPMQAILDKKAKEQGGDSGLGDDDEKETQGRSVLVTGGRARHRPGRQPALRRARLGPSR